MKIFAINGSPRKNYNTAKLLDSFLDGASSACEDAEVELINLYDLNYKGCTECYACKVKDSPNYGKCTYPDDITELLQRMSQADVIAFGSPIYFSDLSGQLRCFLERMFYPFTAFKKDSDRVIAPKKIRTAYFYSMNVNEEVAKMAKYADNLAVTHGWTKHIWGYDPEVLFAYDTYQFENHSKYVADIWDWDHKKKWHEEQFPKDLESAFEIGKKLVQMCI